MNRTTTTSRRRALQLEALESRELLAGDLLSAADLVSLSAYEANLSDMAAYSLRDLADQVGLEASYFKTPVNTLPVLHSNPAASKTLYLNFLGSTLVEDFQARTFGVDRNFNGLVTHVFDLDGDASHFSGTEQIAIRKIWEIVAEDFAPFDIDVTTSYAGSFDDGVAVNVAVGGTSRDSELTSGYAQINGFLNETSNTSLVVTTNIARYLNNDWHDTIQAIGNTVSHEAGHTFGLEHHHNLSVTDQDSEAFQYSDGTDVSTPIMGNNISTDRHTWSYATIGTTDAERQDQLQVLTAAIEARADDHGDVLEQPTPLSEKLAGLSFVSSGLIGTMHDKDVFSFQVKYTAEYRIHVDVPSFGNLDARFALMTADGIGRVIENHLEDGVLDEDFNFVLEAGVEYFVIVDTHKNYGDLGQYTVSVNWVVPEIGRLPEHLPIPFIPELDLINPDPYPWLDVIDDPLREVITELDYFTPYEADYVMDWAVIVDAIAAVTASPITSSAALEVTSAAFSLQALSTWGRFASVR